MDIFENMKQKIQGKNLKIVFPEASDERILEAACRLTNEHLLTPILLGDDVDILVKADKLNLNLEGSMIINPKEFQDIDFFVKELVDRRKGKLDEDTAYELLKDNNYFGTMLVYLEKADGMVSGAIHSTGDTVRPALQIIKTKPNISRVSGAFLMVKGNEKYIFADCAININPNAKELCEIAIESAKTAEIFGIDPKIAMLSFSTKGSAKAPEVEKVVEATKLVKEYNKDLEVDGELQFDAAINKEVASLKAPNSKVAGDANVFIFPTIEAGNIGYKIAQRLGGFEAIGPVLQGLNRPISDLSRGCNVEDVYKLSLITASQAIMED